MARDPIRPLGHDAVRRLRLRAAGIMRAEIDKVLPQGARPERRRALTAWYLRAIGARHRPTAEELARLAEAPIDEIRMEARRVQYHLDKDEEARQRADLAFVRRFVRLERRSEPRLDDIFAGRDRLYLPLCGDPRRATEARVAAALQALGHAVTDYVGGHAAPLGGGQPRRIGKLLAGDPALLAEFRDDPARQAEKQSDRLLAVISRHPYDVARATVTRAWKTCLRPGRKEYDDHLPGEVREGSLIAYLVRDDDPNIQSPLARIMLRPYRDQNRQTIWMPDTRYGMASPLFEHTVADFAATRLNEGLHGMFTLAAGVYPEIDTPQRTMAFGGLDEEGVLNLLRVPFERAGDGHLVARGSIDLTRMNLVHLPDLSSVELTGDFRCGENRLESLHGAPRKVGGSFDCAMNGLESLEGGPAEVGGDYNCERNRLLGLGGAPARVGRDFFCHLNPLESLAGGPAEVGRDYCASNGRLETLAGAPLRVPRDFDVGYNRIYRLEGGPAEVGRDYKAGHNDLSAVDGIAGRIGGELDLSGNPVAEAREAELQPLARKVITRTGPRA